MVNVTSALIYRVPTVQKAGEPASTCRVEDVPCVISGCHRRQSQSRRELTREIFRSKIFRAVAVGVWLATESLASPACMNMLPQVQVGPAKNSFYFLVMHGSRICVVIHCLYEHVAKYRPGQPRIAFILRHGIFAITWKCWHSNSGSNVVADLAARLPTLEGLKSNLRSSRT